MRAYTGQAPNAFTYLGQQYNPATKTNNFQARSYDAATGRFHSKDPIAGVISNPASQHAYQYSYNNPLAFTDANGQFGLSSIIGALNPALKVGAVIGGWASSHSEQLTDAANDFGQEIPVVSTAFLPV